MARDLSVLHYSANWETDARKALVGTLWGIYRGAVVRRDDTFTDLTFYDLYELGMISGLVSYFDSGHGEITKEKLTFDDFNACEKAREQRANPVLPGIDGPVTDGARFSSGWFERSMGMRELLEA